MTKNHGIMDTSFDTPIMFVMYRPALLILISPILSYLPPGTSEGWSSEIIRLSIMWLNSLNTFVQVSFIQTGSIRYVTNMYSFVHEASAPQFITSYVANRVVPNVLG